MRPTASEIEATASLEAARCPYHTPISTASWCNSSIPDFDPDGPGANPGEAAILQVEIRWQVELGPLGGEIESRLAYTQKSEGQNLPERPPQIGVMEWWIIGLLESE
jgi:hypothetical protein